jgi:serine/threonine protein phosphatase PrpC
MTCRRCGASVTPGDRFCSECGVRLAAPEPPGANGRAEAAGPGLAGQTDPGVTHASNQDAFFLSGPAEGGDGSILVLCDGVSNSQTPDLAAATASRTAHDVLAAGGDMRDAIRRAHEAVCALPFDRQAAVDPPATTIVAARLHDGQATIGWLGDSRAYGLGGSGGTLLTRDHSWLAAVLDRGEMTEAEAMRDPRAHALLNCLGTTDFTAASPCPEPGVVTLAPSGGWLLLCSDGLWNYAPTLPALAQAASQGLQGDAADLCARLVDFARSAGGRDNITVIAMRCRP